MRQLLIHLWAVMVMLTLSTAGFALPQKEKGEKSGRPDRELLERVYHYAASVDTTDIPDSATYTYTKFFLRVDRKNPTLMLVPTVYAIAHSGEREYVGETYNEVTFNGFRKYESKQLLRVTTVPHRRKTFDVMLKYMTPEIYNETIIDNVLISPFHAINHRFYRYRVTFLLNGTVRLTFTPKRRNTQLVSGEAIVDYYSGRIVSCIINGEYDMLTFRLNLIMGTHGTTSLIPSRCELNTRFRFVRSKVSGRMVARYGLPYKSVTSQNPYNAHNVYNPYEPPTLTAFDKISNVRPEPLDSAEYAVYDRWLNKQQRNDSTKYAERGKKKRLNFAKDVLWDIVGDNMLNRVKTHFGINNQGYIRLNPMLNPLYMGYDHHRGFIYKFDLRASYQFNTNSEISARLRAGYAFKQHQFYFRVPLYYYFNKRRNGYFKIEVANGNHIRNGSVRRRIEAEHPDSLYDFNRLNEFRQTEVRAVFNHDLSEQWSIQLGTLFQRRSAIYKADFDRFGWRKDYRSFAPLAELQYRPWGWTGPVFTLDYDHGIKGIARSNTSYERWELNGEYIYRVNKLQSWQMRAGAGFYTHKDHDAYFLNYENFKENNLPGGWNDDWSGEFELLRSDTYNTSPYYIRANLTYESPMLLLSWLPLVGRYVEMERVYISTLDVTGVHPYVELGYGFTSRLMSMGIFASNGQGNRTLGVTFGFELFRHW